MSKSTKIIAALGVAAGLGVAALPMATFADYVPQSVTGDVDVIVEIPEAIAMTITGNNDDASKYGTAFSATAVTPEGTENPSTEGWYEIVDGAYVLSEDTTVDGEKTYYEIAGTYQSVDNFSPATGNPSTVDTHNRPAVLKPGTSSSYASLTQNAVVDSSDGTASAADQAFKSTITVYTNSAKGYNLTISPVVTATTPSITYGSTALTNQDDGGVATIPANTTMTAGTSGWAYKVSNAAKTAAQNDGTDPAAAVVGNWTALTQAAPVIDTINAPTSNGRVTTVYYGVSTATDQAAGVYKGTITYTATTKNS